MYLMSATIEPALVLDAAYATVFHVYGIGLALLQNDIAL